MDYIVVTGAQPYDGRYELDLVGVDLTTREWGWIKRLAGYLPVTLEDDSFSDPELACVLAAIAMRRTGRIEAREVPQVFDRLADAPFGTTITIEAEGEEEETEEGDAGPPARSSNGSEPTSGGDSATSSETSATSPERSGIPGSATSEPAHSRLVS